MAHAIWGAEADEAQRLKALELDNSRLKRIVAEKEFDILILKAEHPNHVWSLDFVEPKLASGKSYRVLNVIDEYSRRSLGRMVAFSIGARRVQQELERLFRAYGKPGMPRTTMAGEFIADILADWLTSKGVEPRAATAAEATSSAVAQVTTPWWATSETSWSRARCDASVQGDAVGRQATGAARGPFLRRAPARARPTIASVRPAHDA